MFQLSSADETYFHGPAKTEQIHELEINWGPFFVIDIGLKSDLLQINRKTGTLLDLLSACGGLFRALNVICENIINPYTLYAIQAQLAMSLVRFIPSTQSTTYNQKGKIRSKKEQFEQKYLDKASDPKRKSLL